jgi:NADH-quinone oxidoreductase subunit G
VAGNCRICLVQVEKMPKLAISCNTVVSDGMVVHTQTEEVLEARKAVMEFLLVNHPLDCPICDQAGECKLQDYAVEHGQGYSRFVEEKYHGPKKKPLGPHVLFDWERCIKCTRCIRFTEEITGTRELAMFLRGVREEIGVFPGRPLDNPYSGNVVDICPVGALTLKEFRFRSRVWFLKNHPSACAGCARGCSVNLGTHGNRILRITPRENHAVNRWWICDEGRLSYQRLAGERLAGPADLGAWEAALDSLAAALREAAASGGAALLASPRATNEELYLLARLAADGLGGAPVYLPEHERGEDDGLLLRADRSPNRRGATEILGALAGGARPVEELAAALGEGKVGALLALGPLLAGALPDEEPPLAPALAARAKVLAVADAFPGPLSEAAGTVLPVQHWGESEGSFTSFAGRVQRLAPALSPAADALPLSVLLGELLRRLEVEVAWESAAATFAELAARVPAFAGLDYESLGPGGADLAGADAAAEAPKPTGATAGLMQARG